MSIDRCSRCSALVDTDNETEAYVDVSNQKRGPEDWRCFCQICRERREDEIGMEPRQMPPDWQPTKEQQATMDEAADPDGDGAP